MKVRGYFVVTVVAWLVSLPITYTFISLISMGPRRAAWVIEIERFFHRNPLSLLLLLPIFVLSVIVTHCPPVVVLLIKLTKVAVKFARFMLDEG